MTPKLGRGVDIDVDKLIESRLLVQANSGGGKSWTVRRLVEQTYGREQQIIIDHDGEYHTLREKFDYVLAGKDGDCPADIKSAALLARRLLELGVSAIIDIYELGQSRALFVQRFLDALVNAPRDLWHPVIIVVDEAHKYAPESGKCVSTSAVIDLMTLGRKRGFCGVLATQRIAKLHKDAAAEANNMLIGRTSLDIDMKRAAETLGFTTREDRMSLRTLDPSKGEFFAFGPALSVEGAALIHVGEVQTTHLRAGQRSKKPPPPTEKVKKLLGQLADLPHEAEEEAKTVGELQAQVKQLRRELTAAEKRVPAPIVKVEKVAKAKTKAVITDAQLKRLEKVTDKIGALLAHGLGQYDRTRAAMLAIVSLVGDAHVESKAQPARTTPHVNGVAKRAASDARPALPTAPHVRARASVPHVSTSDGALPVGEAAVLRAAIQYGSLEKTRLSVLTGYKRRTRDAYVARLRERGFIVDNGREISPTDAGVSALPNAAPLPTGAELRDWWNDRLPAGERAIFELVIAAHPDPVAKPEIDTSTGYARRTRDAYVSRLVARGVIVDDRGQVSASDSLFD